MGKYHNFMVEFKMNTKGDNPCNNRTKIIIQSKLTLFFYFLIQLNSIQYLKQKKCSNNLWTYKWTNETAESNIKHVINFIIFHKLQKICFGFWFFIHFIFINKIAFTVDFYLNLCNSYNAILQSALNEAI